MKVLVTGASGFIGGHLIAALLQTGHTVRGLSRKEPVGARRHSGVEYIGGVDVGNATSLTPTMFDGIEAIAHLVGIIQEAKGGQTFERIHVEGTQNIVQWAVGQGFRGRFLYLSALGSAADAPAEYSRSKHAAEQIVIHSGLPYTIFRPSLVLGKDGEFIAQMADLIKHGGLPVNLPFPFIPVPGSGKNKFQPIYVDDLCTAMTKSLTLAAAANQLYEVGGATQLSFNYLIKGLADAMNVKKPMLHAPIPILKIVATIMEAIMPKPPVTRDQLANLGLDNITDSHALSQVFGVQPLSFDQQIVRIYGKIGAFWVRKKQPSIGGLLFMPVDIFAFSVMAWGEPYAAAVCLSHAGNPSDKQEVPAHRHWEGVPESQSAQFCCIPSAALQSKMREADKKSVVSSS